jgi:hypothetical protein
VPFCEIISSKILIINIYYLFCFFNVFHLRLSNAMPESIKKIGVFSSGGDAPGMNANIRAVVRTAMNEGIEAYGIVGGYTGMIKGDIIKMGRKETANIIGRGGTILKTSRSKEFHHAGARAAAAQNLKDVGHPSFSRLRR